MATESATDVTTGDAATGTGVVTAACCARSGARCALAGATAVLSARRAGAGAPGKRTGVSPTTAAVSTNANIMRFSIQWLVTVVASLRNRIESAGAEGMTAGDSA